MKVQGPLELDVAMNKLKPQIVMSPVLQDQMQYLVDKVTTQEVQWYHRVERFTLSKYPDTIFYELTDLVIPWQTVHGAECDTTVEDQEKLLAEVRQRFFTCEYKDDPEKYVEEMKAFNAFNSSLTCWCHSHVNMGVTPSGTDNATFKKMIEDKVVGRDPNQPSVMMILNQKGEVFTRVYDPIVDTTWRNVPITTYSRDIDTQYIDASLKEKITTRSFTKRWVDYTGTTTGTALTTVGGQTSIPDWLQAAYREGALQDGEHRHVPYYTLYHLHTALSHTARTYLDSLGEKVNHSNKIEKVVGDIITELQAMWGDDGAAWQIMNAIVNPDSKRWDDIVDKLASKLPDDIDVTQEMALLSQALCDGWWTHDRFLGQAVSVTNQIVDAKEPANKRRLANAHKAWQDWITDFLWSKNDNTDERPTAAP